MLSVQESYEALSCPEDKRQVLMVQDTLKLGGNILSKIPDMLAGQLVGRLLPEMWRSPHLEKLIRHRVEHSHWSRSSRYCALIG